MKLFIRIYYHQIEDLPVHFIQFLILYFCAIYEDILLDFLIYHQIQSLKIIFFSNNWNKLIF